MRGSREISLGSSLHRASTDALIYIYIWENVPICSQGLLASARQLTVRPGCISPDHMCMVRSKGASNTSLPTYKLPGLNNISMADTADMKYTCTTVSLAVQVIYLLLYCICQWVEAKRLFQEAADLMDYDRKKLKTMWGQFWASHQVRTPYTVEPLNKGHFGANSVVPCREVVPISEVK